MRVRRRGGKRPRIFDLIFSDSTVHAAELWRVCSSTWWDGSFLLVEVETMQRNASDHEWWEPNSETELHPYNGSEAGAVRRAIALHDAATRRVFASADAELIAEGETESDALAISDAIHADERKAGA